MGADAQLFNFSNVLIFFLVGLGFIYINLAIGALVRPAKYEKDKMRVYECGEPTIGSSWIRYNIRFYTIALVFLVFDVETVFLFPVATAMRWFVENGLGFLVLGEVLVFIVILALGLVYAWRFGNLDWVRSVSSERSRQWQVGRGTAQSLAKLDAAVEREKESVAA